MGEERRSIPTRYKGIRFRSKLEADWALYFDSIGLAWEYEREGRYFGKVFYLPDFYLPKSGQYVEVKGEWQPADCKKAGALLRHLEPRVRELREVTDIPLIAANPGGEFWGYRRPHPWEDPAVLETLLLDLNLTVTLAQCQECSGWWFMDEEMGWQCQCCGAWNRHIVEAIHTPAVGWPDSFVRVA